MWTPIAMRKMLMRPKNMMVWTRTDTPLVCMLPNSTTLFLAGSWKSRPGLSSTNRITAITTGPQSAISLSLSHSLLLMFDVEREKKESVSVVWSLKSERNEWMRDWEERNKSEASGDVAVASRPPFRTWTLSYRGPTAIKKNFFFFKLRKSRNTCRIPFWRPHGKITITVPDELRLSSGISSSFTLVWPGDPLRFRLKWRIY